MNCLELGLDQIGLSEVILLFVNYTAINGIEAMFVLQHSDFLKASWSSMQGPG